MSYIRGGVKYDKKVSEMAEKYGYTEAHIRHLASKKKIPSINVGRKYWFNEDQVENALVSINEVEVTASEVDSESSAESLDELVSGI